jgi:hypothetical protein
MSFWRAQLQTGRLMLQQCTACARYVFYPRVLCPHCGCETLHWDEASGGGTVYSTTTVSRRAEHGGNYNVVLVDLDEGVRLMSRVDGIAPENVRIGQRVQAAISGTGDEALLVFKPHD